MAVEPVIRLFKQIGICVKKKRRRVLSTDRTTGDIHYLLLEISYFTCFVLQSLLNAHLVHMIEFATPVIRPFTCVDNLACKQSSI